MAAANKSHANILRIGARVESIVWRSHGTVINIVPGQGEPATVKIIWDSGRVTCHRARSRAFRLISGESPGEPQRISWKRWLATVAAVYVFSVGPMAWVNEGIESLELEWLSTIVEIVYAPLVLFVLPVPGLGWLLMAYIGLFATIDY